MRQRLGSQVYATFKSRIPALIRKHFISDYKCKKMDFAWLADVTPFWSQLGLIFANYTNRLNDHNCNIGQKYLNYAGKVFKKTYYKDRHGIRNHIKAEDLKDKKYLFQEAVDKDGFYDLVKNRPNRERTPVEEIQAKYFDKLQSKWEVTVPKFVKINK